MIHDTEQAHVRLADGCCSAVTPCSWQRSDPTTICAICRAASPSVSAWLAAQVAEASKHRDAHPYRSPEGEWHHAQALAYEAAHAYAIVRKDASAPPAPTPDAGASPLITEAASKWTLSQETLDHLAEIDRATVTAPWSGSDLAKLSDPEAVHVNILRGVIARPSVEQIIHLYGKDALLAALEPPPAGEDLAGQGEPVAWAYEYDYYGRGNAWQTRAALYEPKPCAWVRNIRPLYAAPAPSRPADRGITREDIDWLAREAIRQNNRTLARIAAALLVGGA